VSDTRAAAPAARVANAGRPAVTIILPTYNRAQFLPQAFQSIRAQTFSDWEMIVIDDGSTDETSRLVADASKTMQQPVRYVYQDNRGAYAARNTGLDLANGDYIAFFDSDDYWLPHHLEDCVSAFEANPNVDWIYGACRIVDFTTGRVLEPNTFYVDGTPRAHLRLRTRPAGRLRIIDDHKSIRCMILHGLWCGLQSSMMRRRVFDGRRFQATYRNESEDHVFPVRVLAAGFRLAYYDNVHVIYNVHAASSSASSGDRSLSKLLRIFEPEARGLEELRSQVRLTSAESRALDRRLSGLYFWFLGYSAFWQHGRQDEALNMFRRGLWLRPWNIWYWKTYLLALFRTKVGWGSSAQA